MNRYAKRARNATLAAIFSQLRRPDELSRLQLLLLIWAHTRTRAGYTLAGAPRPLPGRDRSQTRRKSTIHARRLRSRFL